MIRHRQRTRSSTVHLGPADAARLLATSAQTRQRSADNKTVARISEQIRAGRWKTSSTICVSASGLVDGQHRLLGILEAGATVEARVRVISNMQMRCIECPEACHFGGQRTRTKPRVIATRTSNRRSRGRRW